MAQHLHGGITLVKRLRQNPVWERPEYGYCWVDLLLLANDADRETQIRGQRVELKRGQLAWSIRGLEIEWGKSAEWIEKFLSFCQDHGMVKVDSKKNRGTILTILNYDAYNRPNPPKNGTDSGTEPEWNRERGIGKEKGERASAPPPEAFPEIPADETLQCFCGDYRDLARGVTNGIGEVWWRGWVASKIGGRAPFPRDWKRALISAFTADLVSRHPKAIAALSGSQSGHLDSAKPPTGNGENKKNGGRSVAQARFELSRELEELQERLEAAHNIGVEPKAKDVKREQELKREIKQLEN